MIEYNFFKNVATYRKKRDRPVIGFKLAIVLFVNWLDICFFPQEGEDSMYKATFENE